MKYCKFCGKEIEVNSKFCGYCGNSLESNNNQIKEKTERKKYSTLSLIALILLGCTFIDVILAFTPIGYTLEIFNTLFSLMFIASLILSIISRVIHKDTLSLILIIVTSALILLSLILVIIFTFFLTSVIVSGC